MEHNYDRSQRSIVDTLKQDKLALKEALRAAITKRDELYHKVMLFD
jgi:uncharacterized protein YdcH (DUF465 family)